MNDKVMCLTIRQCIALAIIVTGTVGHLEINCDKSNTNIEGNCTVSTKFAEKMWKLSLKTAEKSFASSFVQGLNYGKLSPTKFGAFRVQDAVYLEKQADALNIASQKEQSLEMIEFLTGTAIKYQGYANDMYKDLQLSGSSCVKLDSACEAYTEYKINIAKNLNSKYSIVAMIPCLRLWSWIGGEFESGKQGVYTDWVKLNFNPNNVEYKKYEDIMDGYIKKGLISEKMAMEVYMNCMRGEYHFFKQATK